MRPPLVRGKEDETKKSSTRLPHAKIHGFGLGISVTTVVGARRDGGIGADVSSAEHRWPHFSKQTNQRKESREYPSSSSEKQLCKACLPLDTSQTRREAFCAMEMEGNRAKIPMSFAEATLSTLWAKLEKTRGLAKRR